MLWRAGSLSPRQGTTARQDSPCGRHACHPLYATIAANCSWVNPSVPRSLIAGVGFLNALDSNASASTETGGASRLKI
jgi:hypothetical protein